MTVTQIRVLKKYADTTLAEGTQPPRSKPRSNPFSGNTADLGIHTLGPIAAAFPAAAAPELQGEPDR